MRTLPLLTLATVSLLALPMAHAAPQTKELPPAKKVSISGAYTTELSIGDKPKITIDGPADQVLIKADKDKIEISRKADASPAEIKLTIVVVGLEDLDLSGAQKLKAKGLSGEKLELSFSGASDAELAGTCGKLEIDLSGASKLDASKLSAKAVDLEVSGASQVQVDASEQLRVEASGAAKVRYTGAAQVEKEVSGVASVEKR
jgi:hypothetical protein